MLLVREPALAPLPYSHARSNEYAKAKRRQYKSYDKRSRQSNRLIWHGNYLRKLRRQRFQAWNTGPMKRPSATRMRRPTDAPSVLRTAKR